MQAVTRPGPLAPRPRFLGPAGTHAIESMRAKCTACSPAQRSGSTPYAGEQPASWGAETNKSFKETHEPGNHGTQHFFSFSSSEPNSRFNMSRLSLFRSLDEKDELVKVAVDDAQVLVPARGKRAIGTQGLNGCTCIVVLGQAVLLAHIAPLPDTFWQWQHSKEDIAKAGRDHLAGSLTQVGKLIRQHGDRFPTTSTVFGIFSLGSDGPMTFVINQSRAYFNAMGFDMRQSFYKEIAPETWSPPKGEVVAFYNRNGEAELYQETTKLWPPQAQASSSSSSSRAGTTVSQLATSSASVSSAQTASSDSTTNAQSGQVAQQVSDSTVKVGKYTLSKDHHYLWSPSFREWLPLMKDDQGVQRVQVKRKAYRMLKEGENFVYLDEKGKSRVL